MTSPEAGLAAERTSLAWRRTAIGCMANLLLLLRVAYSTDYRPVSLPALIAVVTLGVVTVLCVRRSAVLHSHRKGQWDNGKRAVTVFAAAIVAVLAAALVIAVVHVFVP